MQGVVRQLLLTLRNTGLHGVDGLGQKTQFVLTLEFDGRFVVAPTNPLRGFCQQTDRARHCPRQPQGTEQGCQQCTDRDPQKLAIKRIKGLHGLIQRALQQRHHLPVSRVAGVGQLQQLAQKTLVLKFAEMNGQARRMRVHERDNAGVHCVRLSTAQHAVHAVIKGHKRHFKVAQRTQLMGKYVVHRHRRHHAHHR